MTFWVAHRDVTASTRRRSAWVSHLRRIVLRTGGRRWLSAEAAWPEVRFGAIGEAWRLYRRHWTVWSLTTLVAIICVALGEGIAAIATLPSGRGCSAGCSSASGPRGSRSCTGSWAMAVAGFFLGGMIRMAVNQVRGRRPRLEDLFSVTDVWFDLCVGSILVGIPLMIGWSLFVIPGMVVAGLIMFVYPLIVDGRLPATGAMIQSYHALKSQWLLATIVHLGIAMVAGLGVILGGIGSSSPARSTPSPSPSSTATSSSIPTPPWEKPHDPFGDF